MTKTIEIEPCARCLKTDGTYKYPYLCHVWDEGALTVKCIRMGCGNEIKITPKDAISSDGVEIVHFKWNAKQREVKDE